MIANSRFVAARIEQYYRRHARVVHPPVDVAPLLAQARSPEDYYLVLGRVVPYKRTDLAVAACERLGRPVKVVGEGRALDAVRAVAGPNTELLGYVGDREVSRLLSGARALLFPGEEDFGIVGVEALAAGTPVVAFGRAGMLDILHSQGGPLFAGPPRLEPGGVTFARQTPEHLAAAMVTLESEYAVDRAALRALAEDFAPAHFHRRFLRLAQRLLDRV
jgi:glycosyltransferase involved in cell wall biosynthesis